ncbi:MAG: ABC transporter permease [Oscillospiraceae bacterium]|nr:ABC transporter permease [Oscillospiraceae bacterium]
MPVYKTFFNILGKQKSSIVIYIIIFIVISIIMTTQGSNEAKSSFAQAKYEISVFDYDDSELSRSFTKYMGQINTLLELEDDKEALQDELFARRIQCVIRIPKDFETKVAGGNATELLEITSMPGTIYGRTISSQTDVFVRTISAYIAADFSLEDALLKTEQTLSKTATVSLLDSSSSGSKSQLYYFYIFVPYLLVCIMLVGIGPCLIVFNKKLLRNRMECSSYPLLRKNIQLLVSTILAAIVITLVFVVLSAVMYGAELFTVKGALFILNAFCFMWVALSIAFFAGLFAKNSNVLNMVGNVVGLGLSFLGGIFVPLEIFGAGMKTVARFLPTYWYVMANDFIESGSYKLNPNELLIYFAIQFGFAVAITSLALALYKARKQT